MSMRLHQKNSQENISNIPFWKVITIMKTFIISKSIMKLISRGTMEVTHSNYLKINK